MKKKAEGTVGIPTGSRVHRAHKTDSQPAGRALSIHRRARWWTPSRRSSAEFLQFARLSRCFAGMERARRTPRAWAEGTVSLDTSKRSLSLSWRSGGAGRAGGRRVATHRRATTKRDSKLLHLELSRRIGAKQRARGRGAIGNGTPVGDNLDILALA